MINGITVIYKEAGFTSHDVVAKMRGICGQKKIGHTGTLDPMATGVLPVCLGNATRLCDMLADRDKEYAAELLLGVETDTQDTTGRILAEHPVEATEAQVREAALSFMGDYNQVPPMYSALKVNGKKLLENAYTLGQMQQLKDENRLQEAVLPVDSVFTRCPLLHMQEEYRSLADNGNAFRAEQTREKEIHAPGRWVRVYMPDESFAGIYVWEPERERYKPVKMFLEKA